MSRLYKNNRDGTFTDETVEAGVARTGGGRASAPATTTTMATTTCSSLWERRAGLLHHRNAPPDGRKSAAVAAIFRKGISASTSAWAKPKAWEIEVRWLSGTVQKLAAKANQILKITEPAV